MTCTAQNQNIGALQTALNRFGAGTYFNWDTLAVDCTVGPQTWDAFLTATWELSPQTDLQVAQETQDQANAFYNDMNSYSDLKNSAGMIAAIIDVASNQLNYGPAPTPPAVQPPRSGIRTNKPSGVPVGAQAKSLAVNFLGLGLPAPVVYIGATALAIALGSVIWGRLKAKST